MRVPGIDRVAGSRRCRASRLGCLRWVAVLGVGLAAWSADFQGPGGARALADDQGVEDPEDPGEPEPGPFVRVRQTRGELDGPNRGRLSAPRWERVHLELEVENRLPVPVGDLELRVELIRTEGGRGAIPGWSFDVRLEEAWVEGHRRRWVSVWKTLPDRREALLADQVMHRVRLLAYRMRPASLGTGLRLLMSPSPSDQRAALDSFEGDRLSASTAREAGEKLQAALSGLPKRPSAKDALRLLYTLRAIGRLGSSDPIQSVLSVEDRLPPKAWGPAVFALASRMVEASEPDAPRLWVLPSWARKPSELVRVRAQDAVPEAVRDAVVQMGDSAVPGLVRALHRGPSEAVRERAWQLLVSTGRATVRAQLRLASRPRLDMIRTFGELEIPDAAPALVELLNPAGPAQRAAHRALVRIGPAAFEAVENALASPDPAPAREVLVALLQRYPRGGRSAFDWPRGEPARRFVERLSAQAMEDRASDLRRRIEQALDLPFRSAKPELDALYSESPAIYREYSGAIAELYLQAAQERLEAENWDAAGQVAREGYGIEPRPEFRAVGATAQLKLAAGFEDLERYDLMEEALLDPFLTPPPPERRAQLDAALNRLALARVQQALAVGDRARARAQLERRRRGAPPAPELRRMHRRLQLYENLPVVAVVAAGAVAAAAALLLVALRFWQGRRLDAVQAQLDGASGSAPR